MFNQTGFIGTFVRRSLFNFGKKLTRTISSR